METDPDVWAEIVDNYRNEENRKNITMIDEKDELELKLKPLSERVQQEIIEKTTPKKKRIYKTKKRKDYARLLDESTELSNKVIMEQINNTEDIVFKSPITKPAKFESKKYAQLVREPCRDLRPTLAKLFTRNLREIGSLNDPETADSVSDNDHEDEPLIFDEINQSESSDHNTFDFPNDDSDSEHMNNGIYPRSGKTNKKFKKVTKFNRKKVKVFEQEKSILAQIDPGFKPTVFATRTYARKSEPTQ